MSLDGCLRLRARMRALRHRHDQSSERSEVQLIKRETPSSMERTRVQQGCSKGMEIGWFSAFDTSYLQYVDRATVNSTPVVVTDPMP